MLTPGELEAVEILRDAMTGRLWDGQQDSGMRYGYSPAESRDGWGDGLWAGEIMFCERLELGAYIK